MFKLIAICPLPGCDIGVRKCLHEGMMYYFCNDYVIAEDEAYVQRNPSQRPVKDNFFMESPKVSISAIVGKNGDGKSSLVELFIRLINNCAVSYNLAHPNVGMRRVKGVKARLYYEVDHHLYKIEETNTQQNPTVWLMADLQNVDIKKYEIKSPKKVDVKMDRDSFFFTFVSNYSHYAYNIYDYKNEWDVNGNGKDDSEKCWLNYILHKNDGYEAPMTLHPYRDKGNIDVNNEKDLSMQRLLSLFINAENPQRNRTSLRRVNGKDAELIVLTEVMESKLQKVTILDYFEKVKNMNNYNMLVVLREIRGIVTNNEIDMAKLDNLINKVLPFFFEKQLDNVLDREVPFASFVLQVIKWIEEKHADSLSQNSDINIVIEELKGIQKFYDTKELNYKIESYEKKYGYLRKINSYQLGRLDTVFRIFQRYGDDVNIVTLPYECMDKYERCIHYKNYKKWSILSTYPRYSSQIYPIEMTYDIRECSPVLEEALRDLHDDKTSHITRKIRQVDNYIKEGFDDGDIYERIGIVDKQKHKVTVSLDRLRDYYGGKFVSLDFLPPPLFERDIFFKKVGSTQCDIVFDSLSSGEKQMLYSLGAIVYHLQNLNNTLLVRYRNVNVILEEIELYFHPEYQRAYVQKLLDMIRGSHLNNIESVNILFVTHSPFILSDIPKNNVLFLNDGRSVSEMQENTFGANIHMILQNAFFLNGVTIGDFARDKINKLFGKLHQDEITEDMYQEIMLVSEPFIKSQLLKIYNERLPHHQMKEMEDRLVKLEARITKSDND